jgi:hypothetical protein
MPERKYKVRSTVTADWVHITRVTGVVVKPPFTLKELPGRRLMEVDTGDSLVRVFDAFNLDDVFKGAKKGDHVDIEYIGTVPTKKKGRTVKRFNARLWSE